MQTENTSVASDVYSLVTDKIIELLEAGTIPWHKPWTDAGLPRNLISKRPYRGINHLLLNAMGFSQNQFLTWKQLKTIGGSVKKGEKGILVVFNKMIEQQKEGETKIEKKSFLRYYKVFNVAQCNDIPSAFIPPSEQRDHEPLYECEQIIEGMADCPLIRHEDDEAHYVPALDYINMPHLSSFDSSPDYYGTLFHELIHSTGHQKRIGRKEVYENPHYGTEMYSLEELVAEMGSCYLKSHTGIPIAELENNAAYIRDWLEVFKGDKRIVVMAASRAQQAVEYILKVTEVKGEPEVVVLEVGE
ncbi:MAG: zincin-like metallopeptidase domain-containing protein [Ferruginibacter sp.]